MTLLAELAAAWIAVSLAADSLRKFTEVDAVGIASVHPAGRMVAIGLIVAITPIGAVLVKRTGVCACRGVVRSNTARNLVVRNASVVAAAAICLVVLDAPVALPAVLAAGGAWLIVLIGQHLLLTRVPVKEVA